MMEIPRLILLVSVLCIASFQDVRSREVSDIVWIIGGGAGAAMYILDWQDVDSWAIFCMLSGGAAALAVWRFFPMGEADALAVLAASVICPAAFGLPCPLVMLAGGILLEHMAAMAYNLRCNVPEAVRGNLYRGVDGTVWAKAAGFYSLHKKRPRERFVFCAERTEDGRRILDPGAVSPDSAYETRTGIFVAWAMPALPFMTISLAGSAAAFAILGA